MTLEFNVVIEKDADGAYVASAPAFAAATPRRNHWMCLCGVSRRRSSFAWKSKNP